MENNNHHVPNLEWLALRVKTAGLTLFENGLIHHFQKENEYYRKEFIASMEAVKEAIADYEAEALKEEKDDVA